MRPSSEILEVGNRWGIVVLGELFARDFLSSRMGHPGESPTVPHYNISSRLGIESSIAKDPPTYNMSATMPTNFPSLSRELRDMIWSIAAAIQFQLVSIFWICLQTTYKWIRSKQDNFFSLDRPTLTKNRSEL